MSSILNQSVLRIFQQEIRTHCVYALLAASDIDDALKRKSSLEDALNQLHKQEAKEHQERQRTRPSLQPPIDYDALRAWEEKAPDRAAYAQAQTNIMAQMRGMQDKVWLAIESMLGQTAKVATLLSAGPKASTTIKQRAAEVMDSLSPAKIGQAGITDADIQNALNKDLRNASEHIDERLDRLHSLGSKPPITSLAQRNIGSLSDIQLRSGPDTYYFNYDPATAQLTFWDKTYDLAQVSSELQKTLDAVDAALGNGP